MCTNFGDFMINFTLRCSIMCGGRVWNVWKQHLALQNKPSYLNTSYLNNLWRFSSPQKTTQRQMGTGCVCRLQRKSISLGPRTDPSKSIDSRSHKCVAVMRALGAGLKNIGFISAHVLQLFMTFLVSFSLQGKTLIG